ncbi:DUF6980 family protein [Fulvivirga ligni]|uniref:DUF6980 family protein n=1 Tax=Fulvivirga ligni TaxID=2904246 RepID=UPI001F478466|nr:hypothetical protein [Fulvivirga ligni]UII20502.1 hypothetical protein LVD16_21930 [Fulvivirga ligni]
MNKLHCCEMMDYHTSFHCSRHKDKYECPDTLIDYSSQTKSYRVIIHDGGTSGIEMNYCPWCGTKISPNED